MHLMENKLRLKFIIAVITVIFSLILGAYTKVMMILHFNDAFKFWLNLILYVISWLMVFIAAFIVGKEVVKLADEYVKKKVEQTYTVTKNTAKTGIKKTKQLHKKTKNFHKQILSIK